MQGPRRVFVGVYCDYGSFGCMLERSTQYAVEEKQVKDLSSVGKNHVLCINE